MREFSKVVLTAGFKDFGFLGNKFTWANNKDGHAYVGARLDKALANSLWLDQFKDPTIAHLLRLSSDHSPLSLSHKTVISHFSIYFEFDEMCIAHDSFKGVGGKELGFSCRGYSSICLGQKLKIGKANLKIWNKQVVHAGNRGLQCQSKLDSSSTELSQ